MKLTNKTHTYVDSVTLDKYIFAKDSYVIYTHLDDEDLVYFSHELQKGESLTNIIGVIQSQNVFDLRQVERKLLFDETADEYKVIGKTYDITITIEYGELKKLT